jgi:toxin FitB
VADPRARPSSGVLDTCTFLDLDRIDPADLPAVPELTAVTLAELHQGVAAIVEFDPLPFDGAAAARYGSLVGLVVAAGRSPKPRRMDLMIASIASVRSLPLYTRNAEDFRHLDEMVTVVEVRARG